jgi:hypothetical protein
MTEPAPAAILALVADLNTVADPAERFRAARDARAAATDAVDGVLAAAVLELKDGRSWREVGAVLDMTGSRAEQIARRR